MRPTIFSVARLWALMYREFLEIWRDPFRLVAAFAVPGVMMVVFGFGLTLDVENQTYASLDRDRTPESRDYLESFAHSRYFENQGAVRSDAELESLFLKGAIRFAIEIPPNYGRDLRAGRRPTIAVWIDGSLPFRAETVRGYVQAIHLGYMERIARENLGLKFAASPVTIETRFWYNQDLKSKYAFVPGLIAVLLLLTPSMLTATAVVREKELGSITNLYATPVTRLEFLLGKQLLYVGVSLVILALLLLMALFVFAVPMKGSFLAFVIGGVLYIFASTGFGLFISAFTRSQLAATLITMIVSLVPSFLFSGLMTPIASLEGSAQYVARAFPAGYFVRISVGIFTKGLDVATLVPDYLVLAGFFVVFTMLSVVLLPKQGA